LNLDTLIWTRIETKGLAPVPRIGASLNISANKLFIFGGVNQKHEYLNDLFILDLLSNTWVKIKPKADTPPIRESHSSVVFNNKIIFYGGMNGKRLSDIAILNIGKE